MSNLKDLLALAGYIILVFGAITGGVLKDFMFILVSVIGGLILLALSKIIGIGEEIQYKVLRIPFTPDQIRTVIKNSTPYLIESADFELYPDKGTRYPLILLDDEYFIRTVVFYNYTTQFQNGYTFQLPDQDEVTLYISDNYYKGVDLFNLDVQTWVKLKKISYKPTILGNKLILKRGTV